MPSTLKLEFAGHTGNMLSARLEMPDATPACFATFSHCFTCNKDTLAAYRISKKLAELGIATLRFDFTGLGDSHGDHAEITFSSMRDDLLAACAFLSEHFRAPQLLIGHSLGGTAALACAGLVDSVRAVVTIASPSQPAHVLHHFNETTMAQLNSGRRSSIEVAGAGYDIGPAFVDDVIDFDMQALLSTMRKPLLIFKVEGDDIVGAGNADELLEWSAGEATLVTLNDTDHVISDRDTAERVAILTREFIGQHI